MSQFQINFTHFVLSKAGGAALTVEKTFHKHVPTISLDCREPNQAGANGFNNETKWTIQLHPQTELPSFLAVLLTYLPETKFQYHGKQKNHALSAEWLRSKGTLKLTFLFAGSNRFIELPREKVFELAIFVSDQVIKSLRATGAITENELLTLGDVDTFIGRCYRPFRTA